MTDKAKKIFEDVLTLGADQRQELVETLYGEFGPKEPGYDAAWAAEIERRLDDLKAGRTKTVPAEQVLKEMRQVIDETRQAARG